MIRLRLPACGQDADNRFALAEIPLDSSFLGDIETREITPYGTGDKAPFSWFPDETVAKAWATFEKAQQKNAEKNKQTDVTPE